MHEDSPHVEETTTTTTTTPKVHDPREAHRVPSEPEVVEEKTVTTEVTEAE